MLAMENLIVLYGIGVLIVDEIQHLSVAKSQGEEMMLNFLLHYQIAVKSLLFL